MADVTLDFVNWAPGTTVDVYERKSELMLSDQPPPGQPVITSAVVQDDQSLTVTNLVAGSYWAIAPIDSVYRYVAFLLDPDEEIEQRVEDLELNKVDIVGGYVEDQIGFADVQGGAIDTSLYRSAADTLKTDDVLAVGSALTIGDLPGAQGIRFGTDQQMLYKVANAALRLDVELRSGGFTYIGGLPYGGEPFMVLAHGSDSYGVLSIDGGGGLNWGPGGGGGYDTTLVRTSGNELKTSGRFIAGVGFFADTANAQVALGSVRTAAQYIIGSTLLAADSQYAFRVRGDGRIDWGQGGSTAPDTNLYRSAADLLKTDDSLQVNSAFGVQAVPTAGQGLIQLAAGASAALGINFGGDTNLYRSAADTLKTDDSLQVGASLAHQGANLGFFNTAVTTKKTVTGAKGSNAALGSLLTALAAYGLITDTTTT